MKHFLLLALATFPILANPAEPLGRLFFTPSERAQLDQARRNKQRPAVPKVQEAPAAPQVLTYSGIVRRSDGKSVLWLNSRPVDEKEALSALAVSGHIGKDGAVTVRAQSGRNVDLKVGQSVELTSGNIAESAARPTSNASGTPAAKAAEKSGRQPEPTESAPPPQSSANVPPQASPDPWPSGTHAEPARPK